MFLVTCSEDQLDNCKDYKIWMRHCKYDDDTMCLRRCLKIFVQKKSASHLNGELISTCEI